MATVVKVFIICIAGADYVNRDLKLTKSRAEALPIVGKRVAKSMVAYLKKSGVKQVSLIEV